MTDFPASHRHLLEGHGPAALATISPSGYPQVTAVAFLLEDDELKISLNTTRKKVRNLRRDPRATVFILDADDTRRYIEIRGDAELEPDPGKAFAARAGAKYGADFTVHDGPGEERVIVTLRPTRINAVDLGAPPPEAG